MSVYLHIWIENITMLVYSNLAYADYEGYTKMQMIRKYKLNNLVNPILWQLQPICSSQTFLQEESLQ